MMAFVETPRCVPAAAGRNIFIAGWIRGFSGIKCQNSGKMHKNTPVPAGEHDLSVAKTEEVCFIK